MRFSIIILFFALLAASSAKAQEANYLQLNKPLNFYDCTNCVDVSPEIDLAEIASVLSEVLDSKETLNIVIDFKISSDNQIETAFINTSVGNSAPLSQLQKSNIQSSLIGLKLYNTSINSPTKTTLFLQVQNKQVILNPVIH